MDKVIAGWGRKRPQIDVPIKYLDLDNTNPRLADEFKGKSQIEIITVLYEQFDLEELAYSMCENGYFDEEPIVVVPENLPKSFDSSISIEKLEVEYQNLIKAGKIKFTVIEGNRRVATLKLLVDSDVKKKIHVDSQWPSVSKQLLGELEIVPAIVYKRKEDISAYLGVRHIAGLLRWEAFAKAVYLAKRIEKGVTSKQSIEESIKEVQRQTADRSDVIRKQYLCFKVLKEAEENLDFDIENVKDRFSLIQVALNSPSIRNFVGVDSYKEVDFKKRLIPPKKIENLEKLLTWIFGNGKDKQPILTDSRKITSRLAPILADDDATEYLLKYEHLEDAYERSGGEKKFLIKKINDATRNLRNALGIAYKYKKTADVLLVLEECIKAAEELKRMIRNG